MRVWTDARIVQDDLLAPWALRSRVASLVSVVSGGIGAENIGDAVIEQGQVERQAFHAAQRVLVTSTWDDTESGEGQGWRPVDGLTSSPLLREGWLALSAQMRWEDISSPARALPRQLGIRVDGILVAVSPQLGLSPQGEGYDHGVSGFSRVVAGLAIGAGTHTIEVLYRLMQQSTSLTPRDTRIHNRSLIWRNAR